MPGYKNAVLISPSWLESSWFNKRSVIVAMKFIRVSKKTIFWSVFEDNCRREQRVSALLTILLNII